MKTQVLPAYGNAQWWNGSKSCFDIICTFAHTVASSFGVFVQIRKMSPFLDDSLSLTSNHMAWCPKSGLYFSLPSLALPGALGQDVVFTTLWQSLTFEAIVIIAYTLTAHQCNCTNAISLIPQIGLGDEWGKDIYPHFIVMRSTCREVKWLPQSHTDLGWLWLEVEVPDLWPYSFRFIEHHPSQRHPSIHSFSH